MCAIHHSNRLHRRRRSDKGGAPWGHFSGPLWGATLRNCTFVDVVARRPGAAGRMVMCALLVPGAAWSWRLRHTFADRPWLRLCSCEDRSSIRRPFLCPHISGAVRRWCRSGCPDSRRSRWEVHMCRAADAGRRDRTVTPRSQWLRKTFGVIRQHVLKPWMKPRSRKVEALCGIREMTKELTGDCTDRPPVTSHVTCPKLRSAPRGQPRACCHGGRASARARTSDKVTSSVVFGLRVLRLPGGAHTSPRSA